jgi:hypothetical protein
MEQFPAEQKEAAPIRNLKTHPMDTIRAIAEVEGPEWFKRQDEMKKGVSDEGAYEMSLPNALERLDEGKESIVYGAGGISRWKVRRDGTVVFLKSVKAMNGERADYAAKLGFEIQELEI